MASFEQISEALIKAHEAGDVENATILAREYDAMKSARARLNEPLVNPVEDVRAAAGAISRIPASTSAAFSQLYAGLDNPWQTNQATAENMDAMSQMQREADAEIKAREDAGQSSFLSRGFTQAGPSLGFTLGAMGSSALAGGAGRLAATALAPELSVPITLGSAFGGSYAASYRMAGAQFLKDAKDAIDEKFQSTYGRPLNEKEQQEAYEELLPLAQEFGHAEAGPESIGNVALGLGGKFVLGLMGKKGVESLVSQAIKKSVAAAGSAATEYASEAATDVWQDLVDQKMREGVMMGVSPEEVKTEPKPFTEALEEIAPATTGMLGLGAAIGGGLAGAKRFFSGGEQGKVAEAPDEQAIAPETEQELSMPDPAEVAKAIGESSVKQLEATGNKASADATQDFLDTANEIAAAEQPVPTGEDNSEIAPEKSAGNAGAAPIEPTVENIEVPTPYVTGNGGQRGEIVAENGDRITVEWRDGTTTTVNKNEVIRKTAISQKIKNKTQISQTSTSGSDLFTVFYFDENGEEHNIGSFLGESEDARDRAFEKALALAEKNAREHNHAGVYYREKKFPVKKSTSGASKAPSQSGSASLEEPVQPTAGEAIQPPTIEPQDNAPREITLEESLPEEPQDGVESRTTEETGVGDQLRSPAEGEVQGEVVRSPKRQAVESVFNAIQSHLANGGDFQIPGNPPLRITKKNANQFSVSSDGDLMFNSGKKGGIIPITDVAVIGSQVGSPFDVLSLLEEPSMKQPTMSDALAIAESDNGVSFDRLSSLIGDRKKASDEIETLTGKDVFSVWPIVVDAVADAVSVSNGQFVDTEAKAEKLRSLYREAQEMPTSRERADAIEQITLASNINQSNRDAIRRKKITPQWTPTTATEGTITPGGEKEVAAISRVAHETDTMPLKDIVSWAEEQGVQRTEALDYANELTKSWAKKVVDKANAIFNRTVELGFFPAKISKDGKRIIATGGGLNRGNRVEVDHYKSPIHAAWIAAHEFSHSLFPTSIIKEDIPVTLRSKFDGKVPAGLGSAEKSLQERVAVDFANWLSPQIFPEHAGLFPKVNTDVASFFEAFRKDQPVPLPQSQTTKAAAETQVSGSVMMSPLVKGMLETFAKASAAWSKAKSAIREQLSGTKEAIYLALAEDDFTMSRNGNVVEISLPKGGSDAFSLGGLGTALDKYFRFGDAKGLAKVTKKAGKPFQITFGNEKDASDFMQYDGRTPSQLNEDFKRLYQQLSKSQPQAAETQTPESVRVDSGAAGVVQSELAEGSIPANTGVLPKIETASTGKEDVVNAAMDDLERSIEALPEKSKARGTPEVMAKARDFYTSEDRSTSRLDGLTQIQKQKVHESLYRADKQAAAEQDRMDKAQRVTDAEIAKAEREEKRLEREMLKREELIRQSLNSIVGPQKKDPVVGTVTKADVETAREALTNSGEIPNAYLTNVYESREAFLADKANALLFPASYARLQTEKNIEGLYENGQTLIFAKQIQVSDLDRGLAKMLGVSDEQAAARRVITHENGHRAISLFTMAEKRELRGYLMRAYSEEQIAELVERYTEYADWRTNPESRLEALEELLMRDFEKMQKIPTGGVWDDIVQFLKRVWRRLTGQKGEPKLKELKDVVRLMRNAMKRPVVPLGSYTLKDGGEVKLSMIAPTARITPEQDAEYLAAVEAGDMKKAQRMVDEAAYDSGFRKEGYHGTHRDFTIFYRLNAAKDRIGLKLDTVGNWFTDSAATARGLYGPKVVRAFLNLKKPLRFDGIGGLKDFRSEVEQAHESVEGFRKWAKSQGYDGVEISGDFVDGELQTIQIVFDPSQIKSADPVTYDDAGNVIPLSQRFQTTSPDIRFSRPQYASDYTAAESAGNETARSTLYSERDMDIREAIRRAYESMPKTNSVAVPIGELFTKTEELMPGVTRDEFGNVLQDLFEDNAAVLQEGNSDFFVTTPEGKKAGFVVVMPRAAKASKIEPDAIDSEANQFTTSVKEASLGREDVRPFEGVQLKDVAAPSHNTNAPELYKKAAIELIDSLEGSGYSLIDIADSFQDTAFQQKIGLIGNPSVPPDVSLKAQQAMAVELKQRLGNASRKERSPTLKRQLEKKSEQIANFYYGLRTAAGQNLQSGQFYHEDPRYRFMFMVDDAEKGMQDKSKETVEAVVGPLTGAADIVNKSEEEAFDASKKVFVDDLESAIEDDEDAKLLKEGEETLNQTTKSLWSKAKMLIMRLAMYARAEQADIKSASKASLSEAERSELNAILRMPKEEREKAKAKDEAELESILRTLVGGESSNDTPEQKKTRSKRKEMVKTAKKRAKKGKDIDVEIEGEVESSEEQVSKAERTAQAILKDLSERYSDPLIIKEKKPNVNAMRELYKERVKQGVGASQMTEESFVKKALELGADEKTAGILWKAAELEIDAREAMRQDKILQRKAAIGERADAQAHRIIFAKERLKRQSGFANIDTNPNRDSIIKAFRDQVKNPVGIEELSQRLDKLNVSRNVSERLFKAAEREKSDLEAMAAYDLLEGPNAIKKMAKILNESRPASDVPLLAPIQWRDIFSQKAKNVEEYRNKIFNAISSNEAFENLDDSQKQRLEKLFSESFEQKRQDILDSILRRNIQNARNKGSISERAEKLLQESRNKIIEAVNLGVFDNDELAKILGEKFDIKTSFTEEEKRRLSEMAEKLQDENLNPAKRNKLAMDFLVELSGSSEIPVTEILSNFWTSSVLFGPQTLFSIGAAFLNGAYGIGTVGMTRTITSLMKGDVVGAIDNSLAALQGMARYLSAFPQASKRAWQYLWSGDISLLGSSANDILGEVKSMEDLQRFKRHKMLAENLAKDPKALKRYIGLYLRFVNRLLTALDAFNVIVTKAGAASIALRQAGLNPAKIEEAERAMNLEPYKKKIIREEFGNVTPTTAEGKSRLQSYAEAEMYRALNELGAKMENADYAASESAFTMKPTGFGGGIYKAVTGLDAKLRKSADDFLNKAKKQWLTEKDMDSGIYLALAYLRHFAAYQAANAAGYKFIRFAGNKFNQGLSYIPIVGMLRRLENESPDIQGKEAFNDSINRNQMVSLIVVTAGIIALKAISDEPDDEKRGWFWNGGWDNLTPDKIKQKLSQGEKPYTIGIAGKVFNYQNWPVNQLFAAIGSMSDLIRFSRNQWNEKNILQKVGSGTISGFKSALEIPALSQMGEVIGNSIASRDPTEQSLSKFSRIASGWVGGFVPRILKDLDYIAEPTMRKYTSLWEKTASQIPIYRRYEGKEYYDILGNQIEKNAIPGSREFMLKKTDPEYKILGALNARDIWLTPANAEHRMVGKGRNRRRLTQEEADDYSLETGKGYRQMLLRYGQRALQMPTERARAFLMDKADEVRDKALKKVYRR